MGHPNLSGPHLTQSKGGCPSVAEDLACLPAPPTKPPCPQLLQLSGHALCPTPRLFGHTPGLCTWTFFAWTFPQLCTWLTPYLCPIFA